MNTVIDIFENQKKQDNFYAENKSNTNYLFLLKFIFVISLALFFFFTYIILMNRASTIGFFLKQEISKLEDLNLELNKVQLQSTELQKAKFDQINTSIVNYANRPKAIMIKIPLE